MNTITNFFKNLFSIKTSKGLIVFAFLSVPIIASFVSTFHIYHLFQLGNPVWIALMLALAFEIGSLSIMLALAVLNKLNRNLVWFIFIVIFLMQIIGNVYDSYRFMDVMLEENPEWLKSFNSLYKNILEMFGVLVKDLEKEKIQTILSLIIGLPIPIISISFFKSLTQYLDNSSESSNDVSIESASNEEKEKIESEARSDNNTEPKKPEKIEPDKISSNLVQEQPSKHVIDYVDSKVFETVKSNLFKSLKENPKNKKRVVKKQPTKKSNTGGVRINRSSN
jgi:hypothetical protein